MPWLSRAGFCLLAWGCFAAWGQTPSDSTAHAWESLWVELCQTAHCVSSDTALWGLPDGSLVKVGTGLDSATVAPRMAALDATSELDLRWNPVAQRRIEVFGTKRTKHLGSMLGRKAMYFPSGSTQRTTTGEMGTSRQC